MNAEPLPSPAVSDPQPLQGGKPGIFSFILDVVETLVLSVALFFSINLVTVRIRVNGFSMEPTLHNNEFLLVNKIAYQFGKPQSGDIIVFHYPGDPAEEYIKRVIGVPGDEIQVSQGKVYRNGRLLSEPYIAAAPKYSGIWTVPKGELFVLGDNRNNSSDSHSWGPLPLQNVVGKALVVYWPPENWGAVTHTVSAAP